MGGSEVQMDPAMLRQPTVLLGFVGSAIVHHHVQFPARIEGHHLVQEGKKIAAATALRVSARDLAGMRAVGRLLMPHPGIYRLSMQLRTSCYSDN